MRAWDRVGLGVALSLVIAASVVQADVTGSYDGQLTGKKLPQAVAAAFTVTQVGGAVNGTLALGGSAPSAGAYMFTGTATAKKLKVKLGQNTSGVRFKWQGKIIGDAIQGKAQFKGPGAKIAGTLSFMRNVSTSDGSACDHVYQDNQMLFVDQVLGQALVSCTTCHVAGGQAQSTRFRITPNDPLATARSVAALVNSGNPPGSRILQKPLDEIPHGGLQQLTPGSPQEQILEDWVRLVQLARCS